jgi:hypothetical protein
MVELAIGNPGWPHPSTSWDWWAPVGLLLTLFLLRRSLHAPFIGRVIAAAIVGGLVFAQLVHRLGVAIAMGLVLLAWTLMAGTRRRAHDP